MKLNADVCLVQCDDQVHGQRQTKGYLIKNNLSVLFSHPGMDFALCHYSCRKHIIDHI